MLKGQYILLVVLQRIGLKYKTSIDSGSGFIVKFLLSYLRLVVIGCLTLRLRMEKALVQLLKSQLVENVVKSTMLISLRGRIFSLVIERVVTR